MYSGLFYQNLLEMVLRWIASYRSIPAFLWQLCNLYLCSFACGRFAMWRTEVPALLAHRCSSGVHVHRKTAILQVFGYSNPLAYQPFSNMDIDACIETIKTCKYLPESDMRQLCNKVRIHMSLILLHHPYLQHSEWRKPTLTQFTHLPQAQGDSYRRIHCCTRPSTSYDMWRYSRSILWSFKIVWSWRFSARNIVYLHGKLTLSHLRYRYWNRRPSKNSETTVERYEK